MLSRSPIPSRPKSASTRSSPRCYPRKRTRRLPSCGRRDSASPWWATASTTPGPRAGGRRHCYRCRHRRRHRVRRRRARIDDPRSVIGVIKPLSGFLPQDGAEPGVGRVQRRRHPSRPAACSLGPESRWARPWAPSTSLSTIVVALNAQPLCLVRAPARRRQLSRAARARGPGGGTLAVMSPRVQNPAPPGGAPAWCWRWQPR